MDFGTTTIVLSGDNPPRKTHPYLMFDSIFSTGQALKMCLEPERAAAVEQIAAEWTDRKVAQVLITGCGTSYNAGKTLVYAFEQVAGLPARLVDSLEFLTYPPARLGSQDALVAISHSGNTLPAIRTVEMARARGAYTVSIAGNPAGRLAAATDAVLLDPAGQELPRPKTRSYSVTCFQGLQLAAAVGALNGHCPAVKDQLEQAPDVCQRVLAAAAGPAQEVAASWEAYRHFLVAGSGTDAGNALEIGLKLMETIGVPATGFELEEFTHGPGYCLAQDSAVILLQTNPDTLYRSLQAASAVHAAGARLLVITAQPDADWPEGTTLLPVPAFAKYCSHLLSILPAQFFIYGLALARGQNPDVAMNDHPPIQRLAQLMFPKGTH